MKNCCPTWNGSRLQYKYLNIVSINLLQSEALFISLNGTCESIIENERRRKASFPEFPRVAIGKQPCQICRCLTFPMYRGCWGTTVTSRNIYWRSCNQFYSMRTSSDRRKKANSTLRSFFGVTRTFFRVRTVSCFTAEKFIMTILKSIPTILFT